MGEVTSAVMTRKYLHSVIIHGSQFLQGWWDMCIKLLWQGRKTLILWKREDRKLNNFCSNYLNVKHAIMQGELAVPLESTTTLDFCADFFVSKIKKGKYINNIYVNI